MTQGSGGWPAEFHRLHQICKEWRRRRVRLNAQEDHPVPLTDELVTNLWPEVVWNFKGHRHTKWAYAVAMSSAHVVEGGLEIRVAPSLSKADAKELAYSVADFVEWFLCRPICHRWTYCTEEEALDGMEIYGKSIWGRSFAVYRLFSEDGELLYVGKSKDWQTRFRNHRNRQPWWGEVAYPVIEFFDCEASMSAAEELAIAVEQPKYNVVGKKVSVGA